MAYHFRGSQTKCRVDVGQSIKCHITYDITCLLDITTNYENKTVREYEHKTGMEYEQFEMILNE